MIRWLYLDMNSFFASCEQQENPALRGKPIAVVPMLNTDSTCAIAASYEAKAFGIKTGTSVGDAKAMCPGIIFVRGSHRKYVEYHHRVLKAVESCIPVESVCSIDEFACLLKGDELQPEKARALAAAIKHAIRIQAGECLTSSIGIAPNMFLAKIAADMQKPDGLTIIHKEELPQALYGLKLRDLIGIGPRMERRLWKHRIFDVETLCGLDSLRMRAIWGGVNGMKFHQQLHGEEVRFAHSNTSCIGHQHVLEPNLRTPAKAFPVVIKLLEKAAERMRGNSFYCRRLSLQVKFTREGGYFEESISFHETQDTLFLIQEAKRMWQPMPQLAPLRVGVTLSGLVPASAHQLDLFSAPRPNARGAVHSREDIMKAVDVINHRYGRGTIRFGGDTTLQQKVTPDKIAFQRVPELYEVA